MEYKTTIKSKSVVVDSRCRDINYDTSKYLVRLPDTIRDVVSVHLTGIRIMSDQYISNSSNSCPPGKPINEVQDVSGITHTTVPDHYKNFLNVQINHNKKVTFTASSDYNIDTSNSYPLGINDGTPVDIDYLPQLYHIVLKDNQENSIFVDVVVHSSEKYCSNNNKCPSITNNNCSNNELNKIKLPSLTYQCLKNKSDYDYYILKIPEIGGSIISNCDAVSKGFTIIPKFHANGNGDWNPDPQTLGNIVTDHECSPPILLDKLTIEWTDYVDKPVFVPEHVLVFKIVYKVEEITHKNNICIDGFEFRR